MSVASVGDKKSKITWNDIRDNMGEAGGVIHSVTSMKFLDPNELSREKMEASVLFTIPFIYILHERMSQGFSSLIRINS